METMPKKKQPLKFSIVEQKHLTLCLQDIFKNGIKNLDCMKIWKKKMKPNQQLLENPKKNALVPKKNYRSLRIHHYICFYII